MALSDKILTLYNPTRCIEWVVALCTLAGGLYIFSPLYRISQQNAAAGVIAQIFAHSASVWGFALLLIAGSLLVIIGIQLNKPAFKSIGFFTIFLVRFFQIISTWIIVGFFPITWIYLLTIMLICAVLYFHARVEVRNYGA